MKVEKQRSRGSGLEAASGFVLVFVKRVIAPCV